MRDFDRPLTERGRVDAGAVGMAMRVCGFFPDLVLSSTARRARETWECVALAIGLPAASATLTDGLYSCDAGGYLTIIRNGAAEAGTVLVVGHNPMMEDLATALAGNGEAQAMAALGHGLPTSALAVIAFAGNLATAMPGKGHLEVLLTPSEP
jgi:phosphohistidine phosphatase